MKRFLNLFILFVALSSFDYKERANQLQKLFIKEASQTYGVQVFAMGAGMPFDIQILDLDFQKVGLYSVEEARGLFIPMAESFLNFINSEKVLRPYLHDFPFKAKNIGFSIMFLDSSGERPPSNYVAYVSVIKGRLYYAYFDPKTQMLIDVTSESFEEAQQKVHGVTK